MQRFHRRLAGVAALAMCAPLIGACSSDMGAPSSTKPDVLRPDWLSFSGHKDEFTLRPPGSQDLVNADGQCAAAAVQPVADPSADPTMPALVQGGIALQMTECDVVRRAGSPDRVEAGANERGERSVVLTYMRGPKPGVYRFVGGRLASVERGQEAPAPARQQGKKCG